MTAIVNGQPKVIKVGTKNIFTPKRISQTLLKKFLSPKSVEEEFKKYIKSAVEKKTESFKKKTIEKFLEMVTEWSIKELEEEWPNKLVWPWSKLEWENAIKIVKDRSPNLH